MILFLPQWSRFPRNILTSVYLFHVCARMTLSTSQLLMLNRLNIFTQSFLLLNLVLFMFSFLKPLYMFLF